MKINPSLFDLSQKERILTLLQERGDEGVMVYEIMAPRPNGLGIAQYNARIKELRELGHKIINVTPGHFVLKSFTNHGPKKPEVIDPQVMKTWGEMGAFLRGEGPKPGTTTAFKETVQNALL